ncbi:MAG: hypothetical protein BGO34_04550 [Bacteroidia bacterium 44-10]|nr:MAG: hypothetical protein BGO34_04550 [Bacteroidia bacterium 44-10]
MPAKGQKSAAPIDTDQQTCLLKKQCKKSAASIEKLRGHDALIAAKIFYPQPTGLVAGINLFKLLLVPHRFFADKSRTI